VGSVRALVDARPDALQARCNAGWRPLHVSVLHELVAVDVVRFLAERGPDALLDTENHEGYAPLHLAARSRRSVFGTVQCLLDLNPHALTIAGKHDGRLPLHVAVQHAGLDVVQAFVDGHPDADAMKDRHGWLPVHVAVKRGSVEILQFLVDQHP
jgi:ankyrin repeat protein